MSDPRETLRNDRVADARLPAELIGDRKPVTPEPKQVCIAVSDLCRAPDGARDRQVLFGETVAVYETVGEWAFVAAQKDGYVGYMRAQHLQAAEEHTHFVARAATHAYSQPSFKSREVRALSFGSAVRVVGTGAEMFETPEGFIPVTHLAASGQRFDDPLTVARLFLGAPYLWGGNSWWGIDCSGLVQAACLACGIACPGDSDQQSCVVGEPVPDGSQPEAGDLLFWKGHVAWVSAPGTLLHASSHNMETKYEPLDVVRDRIAGQGDGPIIAHRRLRLR